MKTDFFDYFRGEQDADFGPGECTLCGFTDPDCVCGPAPATVYAKPASSHRPSREFIAEVESMMRTADASNAKERPAIGGSLQPQVDPSPQAEQSLVRTKLVAHENTPAGQGEAIVPVRGAGVAVDDPCHLARVFLAQPHYQHKDGKTLRVYRGEFAKWQDGAYSTVSDASIRAELVKFADAEFTRVHQAAAAINAANAEKGQPENKKAATKLRVTRTLVGDVTQAVAAFCQVPEKLNAPGWIDNGPDPRGLIAAPNGLLDLRSFAAGRRELIPATPRFLTFNRVDFAIDPYAPPPVHWIGFLDSLWPDDPDSILCLQEWFGYLLTPDTSRHKILMLIGPPRAGKGTIGRVLKLLVGIENVVSPTLAGLTERFGLQSFIGKSVALLADARLSNRADTIGVTEQLLSIAGEDSRTIDRKGLSPITTTLGTRFVCMSNELPRFGEASGALVGRLVILRLTRTFADNPDLGLLNKLIPELPGILLWSIDGWNRLEQQGRFTAPASAQDLNDEAEDLASPVKTFIRDQCELGDTSEHEARKCDLFATWQKWCRSRGRDHPGTQEMFFRDLRAAVPNLRSRRPRSGQQRYGLYQGIRILSPIETGEIE